MIDKKTVDVFAMFNEELNSVKKELTQKTQTLYASLPRYAGTAAGAKMLKKGLERSMMVCALSLLCSTLLCCIPC